MELIEQVDGPELIESELESIEIKDYDYIELYVGNVQQAAYFFKSMFGLTPIAYLGLETGSRDRVSVVLKQNKINLLLTGPISNSGEIADHLYLHGEGVKDIAFTVDDSESAFEIAVKRGATPVLEPTTLKDNCGTIIKSSVKAFDDTIHSFIQRNNFYGSFWPNFCAINSNTLNTTNYNLVAIDHVAIATNPGRLQELVDYYQAIFGFHQSYQQDIETEYSAMNSKVLQNSTSRIKFPIMEPATGKRKSQIEEYLDFYVGSGAQHIAFLSRDIISTISALKENGVEFLKSPDSYYEMLGDRIEFIEEDIEVLKKLNILVDRDESGYLMQIFSKPMQNRPTLFFEIIQRRGSQGFGGGNVRALYEANEREQARRGNLLANSN